MNAFIAMSLMVASTIAIPSPTYRPSLKAASAAIRYPGAASLNVSIEGASCDKSGKIYAVNQTHMIDLSEASAKPLIMGPGGSTSHYSCSRFTKNYGTLVGDAAAHKVCNTSGKQLISNDKMLQPNDMTITSDETYIYLSGMNYEKNTGDLWMYNTKTGKTESCELTKGKFYRINGIELSPDDSALYITSAENSADGKSVISAKVWKFEIEKTTGKPLKPIVAIDLYQTLTNMRLDPKAVGMDPDGMRMDSKGTLFITLNAFQKVLKWDTSKPCDTAEIIDLQTVKYPSNCEFGGTEGKELVIIGRCADGKSSCVDSYQHTVPGRAYTNLNSGSPLPPKDGTPAATPPSVTPPPPATPPAPPAPPKDGDSPSKPAPPSQGTPKAGTPNKTKTPGQSTPSIPEKPDYPVGTPDKPNTPEKPNTPNPPRTPESPYIPKKPDTPGTPGKPTIPDHGSPQKPETPSKPVTQKPTESGYGTPDNTSKSAEPPTYGTPKDSGKPTTYDFQPQSYESSQPSQYGSSPIPSTSSGSYSDRRNAIADALRNSPQLTASAKSSCGKSNPTFDDAVDYMMYGRRNGGKNKGTKGGYQGANGGYTGENKPNGGYDGSFNGPKGGNGGYNGGKIPNDTGYNGSISGRNKGTPYDTPELPKNSSKYGSSLPTSPNYDTPSKSSDNSYTNGSSDQSTKKHAGSGNSEPPSGYDAAKPASPNNGQTYDSGSQTY